MVQIINYILASLTVFAQILILFLAYSYFFSPKGLGVFKNNYLILAFIVALAATLGSLFYSEIAGYEPCKLCWFQRILMYPQAIILGVAWLKKDRSIVLYSIILSSLGALIAGYNYLLQIGFVPSIGCSAVGYSINCSQELVSKFGFLII